jgi:hypothetical protein
MVQFRDLLSLEKFIIDAVRESLRDDVIEKVKDVQLDKIQTVVYDAYLLPVVYIRRRDEQGGLLTRDNIKAYPSDGGLEYTIINETRKKGISDYLTPLIEYGHRGARAKGLDGYDFPRAGWDYMKPRPFVAETYKHFVRTKEHVEVLKRSLEGKGFEVGGVE